jgi:hypothetical protein
MIIEGGFALPGHLPILRRFSGMFNGIFKKDAEWRDPQ